MTKPLIEPLASMPDPAKHSVRTSLRMRTVCPNCGHLHREKLVDDCNCCGEDWEKWGAFNG